MNRAILAAFFVIQAVSCGSDKPADTGGGRRDAGNTHQPGGQDAAARDGGAHDGALRPDGSLMRPDAPVAATCGMAGPRATPIGLSGSQAGILPGSMSRFMGSCGGNTAGELVYYLDVDRPLGSLEFRTKDDPSAPEVVLYVRSSCEDSASEVVCGMGKPARMIVPSPQMGQRYWVFVDGTAMSTSGTVVLEALGRLPDGAACDPLNGAFRCNDGSLCAPAAADAGALCRKPMCSDGMDNDGDGKMDFPNEPGCQTAADDDEMDPTPLPVCADGMDNDMDGKTDFPMDTDCQSASGDSEAAPCGPGIVVEDITATGMAMATTLATEMGNFMPSCSSSMNTAPERIYSYRVTAAGRGLRATTLGGMTTLDTVVYIRKDICAGAGAMDLACNDDDTGGVGPSTAEITMAAPGTYFIIVDGYMARAGTFQLTVSQF